MNKKSPPNNLETSAHHLQADVEAICLPHGRVVGTEGHEEARAILATRLAEVGCVPFRGEAFDLPYQRDGISFCNLVGVIRGSNPELAPLLVGAHYDSVIPAPCADDNAAAVAIALATAERARDLSSLERDLIVAIFDAEEPPHFLSPSMGSRRFWHDQLGSSPIHAALIMDLVGHDIPIEGMIPGALTGGGSTVPDNPWEALKSLLFMTGAESHPDLAELVSTTNIPEGLRLVPTRNAYVGDMSDHEVFRKNGVPYFFLSCGHWEHYHTPTDTPDRLNYEKMARIADQVWELLLGLDSRPLPRAGHTEQISETLELESRCMREAFGPALPFLLQCAGVPDLRTRADMDALVKFLLSTGL
jgi:hypothetical protein